MNALSANYAVKGYSNEAPARSTLMTLSGKRVLFIAPIFFGYEKLIKNELEQKGAQVDYYNDRPGGDFLTKALIRIDRRLLAHKTNRYYDNIIESTKKTPYDYILIVRGEAISIQRLRMLRLAQPQAKLTLYLWDSIHYNPNARTLLPEFDRVFSFDRKDVDENPKMEFLPLFYGQEFERAATYCESPTYDACFIGTIHTDRYKVLEKVVDSLESKGRKIFVYCYYPSKLLFRIRSLFEPGFRRFAEKYIDFTGMTLAEVVDHISRSREIIDINRPDQLGLTIRSIEAVGGQRKLITTNTDIINYDIYSSQSINLIDRNHPTINDSFFEPCSTPYNKETRIKYSVSNWAEQIFSPTEAMSPTK